MDSQPLFYVYALFRPWNGQPFYVGKGKEDRWLQHESGAHRHPNKRMARTIAKARRLGLSIPRIKIRDHLSEVEAFEIERAFIVAIGRAQNGGPLLNLTDGGEGFANPSPEIREKLCASLRRRFSSDEAKAEAAQKTKMAWQDPEKRKRMMEARPQQVASPETRAKLAAASRLHKHTPEAKTKISNTLKGHNPSAETRAIWSSQRKGRVHSPEYCAKMKAIKSTPEAIDKNRRTFLAALTPETRAKMSTSAKAAWARKRQLFPIP